MVINLMVSAVSPVFASTTDVWMTASAEDFARGKLKNVNILSTGQIAPGLGTTRFPIDQISIWSTTFAADGKAYIGTGNNGYVYTQTEKGFEKVFETGEAVVTTLVHGGDGTLYAGTIPNGKIFALRTGEAPRLLVDLEVPYIWDIIYHQGLKQLLVGTGPDGKIFQIDMNGTSKMFFDSNESHIQSLVEADNGTVYAGTSMRGILYHFDRDGKVLQTWDLEENELRSLWYKEGSLFLGANKIKSYQADIYFMSERDELQDRSQFARLLAARIGELQAGTEAVEKSFQELFSAVIYRLTPENNLHRILEIPSRYVCDIGVDKSDVVYVATGDEGELWAATEPNLGWVLMDQKETQIISVGIYNGELSQVATGNAAAVYQIHQGAPRMATFTSKVKDTGFRSKWGQIEWKSTGSIQVETRTGSHANPDITWSDWSRPIKDSGMKVKSPNARFIQFRIQWSKNSDSRVDWIRLTYINENQRPRIKEVFTALFQDAFPSTKGQMEIEEGYYKEQMEKARGKVRIEWKAIDPDGDNLLYWIYYRREGDKEWVIINPKVPVKSATSYYDLRSITMMKTTNASPRLKEVSYEWPTTNVADGWYMIKVVASDERDNAENPMKVWKEVGPILIDNRKPEIKELKSSGDLTWTGLAEDDTSHIARLEYNVDGEKWEILKVQDGIYDNKIELFTIKLKNIIPGEHVLTVRAFDEGTNIGMRQVGFTKK